MKKVYYSLILTLAFSMTLPAQTTITCGAPGTSITINSLDFISGRRGGCLLNYDITITASEVGAYSIEALGQTLVAFTISDPGIVQFQGEARTVFPCILITNFLDELDIVTPSGSCGIDVSSLLPVKLTYFTAEEAYGATVLKWGTATEINNEGFTVEHTQNGEDWKPLGFVKGVGTTDEPQNYDFRIENLPSGMNYFRLKQIDFDGRFEYSPVANIQVGEELAAFKIFPNPIGRGQQLNIRGTFDQAELFNAAGQKILQFQSANELRSPQFLDLPAGFYHLVIQRKQETLKEKLIIH